MVAKFQDRISFFKHTLPTPTQLSPRPTGLPLEPLPLEVTPPPRGGGGRGGSLYVNPRGYTSKNIVAFPELVSEQGSTGRGEVRLTTTSS